MQTKRKFLILLLLLDFFTIVYSEEDSSSDENDYVITTTTFSPRVPTTTPILKLLPGKSTPLKQRSLFGEHCNRTMKCKSGSWLTCDSSLSRCHCTKPDEMVWDEGSSKCVVLIGEICRFGIAGPEGDANHLYEIAGCVENAFCNLDIEGGTCQCRSTHYENDDGSKCSPKKGHGSQCNSNGECSEFKRLTCNANSTCACEDPSTMLVDHKDDICKVKIGSDCSSFQTECFDTSTCAASKLDASIVCTCADGDYGTLDGTRCLTVKDKGSTCSRDVECNASERLSCVANMCSCDPQISVENMQQFTMSLYVEYYGYNIQSIVPLGTCLAKVGSNCTAKRSQYSASPDEIYCIQNAVCNQQTTTCECQAGMAKTGNNLCGNMHGTTCSESSPCTDALICDYNPSSNQRICKCPSPNQQVYEATSKECMGKPGASCSPGKTTSCIPNASCEKEINYQCECNSGFVERESTRECDIAYGHPCKLTSSTPQCDQQARLRCILNYNGTATCLCPDAEDIYEPMRTKCSRGVGRSCMKTEDCVENAYCGAADGRRALRCKCNNGYEKADNLTCTMEEKGQVFSIEAINGSPFHTTV